MKSNHQNLIMRTKLRIILPLGLAAALIAVLPAVALRPELRIDAPTADGRITQLNAQLLEQAQFAHRGLDDAMAARFLESCLDALDGSHELFYQSDIDEFRRFLPGLAEATRRAGDTRAARAIFERYLQRAAERADFVEKALTEETFDFTGNDRYMFDRKDAPRPPDAAAARELWRQHLRADFLQLEIYLNALAHIYDPHSDYMGSQQLESFNISMNLSLAGIGAMLQADGDYCKITGLVPGGPAARGGKLKAGDGIVAVAQGTNGESTDLFNFPLAQTVELIRVPRGLKTSPWWKKTAPPNRFRSTRPSAVASGMRPKRGTRRAPPGISPAPKPSPRSTRSP